MPPLNRCADTHSTTHTQWAYHGNFRETHWLVGPTTKRGHAGWLRVAPGAERMHPRPQTTRTPICQYTIAVNDVDAAILAATWQSVASDAVPEPGTLTLSAICGLMLLGLGDRRRKR